MASKPTIVAVLGARGTGKSAWVQKQLERSRPKRLVVWDYMQEYSGGSGDLAACIRALSSSSFRVVFHPSHDDRPVKRPSGERSSISEVQFALFCQAAYEARNCTVVVEELAFVTKASSAPAPWRRLSLLGRHQGVSIIGTSQRPASIDKDFLANADLVHCGRLAYKPDADKAAMVLGVDADELLRLPDLAYIERRAGAHDCTRGTLSFNGSKRARPVALGKEPKARNSTAA
jgi:hypothetical protein